MLVTTVLDNLAAGMDEAEILQSYPSITRDSIHAAVNTPLDGQLWIVDERRVRVRG